MKVLIRCCAQLISVAFNVADVVVIIPIPLLFVVTKNFCGMIRVVLVPEAHFDLHKRFSCLKFWKLWVTLGDLGYVRPRPEAPVGTAIGN
ncbi:unnamed protein product [Sphenostylis stenocarpa]|uniref:Uncharacterized protein n=1 Tax=Sphenostylis stenocarpa TaxID=92480 RepID=A0AA86RZ57_9FABA|nr:unnamed protein product [Sphenostylis stenocarpa]CAJ1957469.1 unnamed protein product [Sphenostylis stenocarpa]